MNIMELNDQRRLPACRLKRQICRLYTLPQQRMELGRGCERFAFHRLQYEKA